MKFTKMSLVAALLMGSSAFAIDNIKMSGDAKLYYATQDANDVDLFHKDGAAADAALNLNITADLLKNDLVTLSAGAGYTVLSTLGLENNLVSNVWGGAHMATAGTGASFGGALGGVKVENASWMNEAWVALSFNKGSKSTLKLGRMELDTPLAFTETWSIEKNTFEAAVYINQDIPDTTLVGAYVGNGNGTETFGQDAQSNTQALGHSIAPIVNGDGQFTTFATNGAYAAAVVNNSWKPLVAQAWYYRLTQLASAYWLQADLDIIGITAGLQYAAVDVDNASDASSTFAGKIGYEMKDLFSASFAYSMVDDKGDLGPANTATSTGASKLYTEAWWNYGYVSRIDTTAYNVTVTSPVNGIVDLGLYYTASNTDATNVDMSELTLTAGKSFGPLDTTFAYIFTDADDKNEGDSYNAIQAYLTLNF
jgi:hypothetical protein